MEQPSRAVGRDMGEREESLICGGDPFAWVIGRRGRREEFLEEFLLCAARVRFLPRSLLRCSSDAGADPGVYSGSAHISSSIAANAK